MLKLLQKIIDTIINTVFILVGVFVATCGGVQMLYWQGFSIGLFGIIFCLPGVLLIYAIVSRYIQSEQTRAKLRLGIGILFVSWILFCIVMNVMYPSFLASGQSSSIGFQH